jgi:FlaA1/EpsC-like NDP-sugar epimerase
MLLRDRQLRTQIYQLMDAGLFALSLWLAHWLRDHAPAQLLGWKMLAIEPFQEFVWLYLVIIPGVPLILESQGFYQRPIQASRRETAWLLFKSCVLATIGVILVMFLFRITLARSVFALFGVISFVMVTGKEELLRLAYRTRFGQLQLKKRVLLIGAQEDTGRMRQDLLVKGHDDLEIVGELDINNNTIQELVNLLHETSANGVILNAKHTFFGQIERAIHACEIEGVEAWLIADFFKTHIS